MREKTNTGDTISVVEAARRLGIGRNLAYAAAASGAIPALRIGRTLRVPVRRLERLLDGPEPEGQGERPASDIADIRSRPLRRGRDALASRDESHGFANRSGGAARCADVEGNEQQ